MFDKYSKILLILLLVLTSCKEPKRDYAYSPVPQDLASSGKGISFMVDMKDPGQSYNMMISARLNRKFDSEVLMLSITAVSPSGKRYGENISLPANAKKIRQHLKKSDDTSLSLVSSKNYFDMEWCYRNNIKPVENGTWEIILAPHNNGIEGLGINLTTLKKKRVFHFSDEEAFIDAQYKDGRFK